MGVPYYGDFAEDDTVNIPFNSYTSDNPSASVTIGAFAAGDVHIHKDAGVAPRNNAAGITASVDHDGITGNHIVTIDTNDNTVGGFWVTGSEYQVRIEGTTIDGATINAFIGAFSIERAGGVLAVLKAGTTKVDVETIKTQAVTAGAGVTIRADVGAAAAPGAANGMFIGGTNAATTVASLSCTGALDAGSLLIDTTTTLSGNVSMGGTFDVVGALTANSVSIDAGFDVVGALSANSLLIDANATVTGNALITGTTTHTGAVAHTAGLASDITGDITGNLSGTVGTLTTYTGNTPQTADNDAKLDTAIALLDDARGEPAQGSPPVNPDAMTKIDWLYKAWRNKKDNDGTDRQIYNDAGAVVDHKSGVAEAGGTVTVDEWESGP